MLNNSARRNLLKFSPESFKSASTRSARYPEEFQYQEHEKGSALQPKQLNELVRVIFHCPDAYLVDLSHKRLVNLAEPPVIYPGAKPGDFA